MFPVRHFGHVVGYDRHAFHEAEQFADVAGPRMAQQGPLKLGDEQAFRRGLVEMFPQMGNGEIHNVLKPLPEWREAQREHVEAVKEVRPEPFLCHKLAEILMRGAQDAYVEGDHLRPAHAYQFPFLKHAQQPPLKGKRQVSDFIEEQGSGVGQLEHARLALTPRAGKRAFLIAEKFAFQQPFGDGGTVHGHERLVFAQAGGVDALGE